MDDRFRRQQRRRAIIGWSTGALAVALFVAAAIFGEKEDKRPEPPRPSAYSMTAKQYVELRPGLDESRFVSRLGKAGLSESLTKTRYVLLFPPHPGDVACSFWEISDRPGHVARICFSSPGGRLLQKLERDASGRGVERVIA